MTYHWCVVSLYYEDGNYVSCDVQDLDTDGDLRSELIASFHNMSPEIIEKIQLDFDWMGSAPIEDVIEAVLDFGELIYGYKNKTGDAWVSISKVQGPKIEYDMYSTKKLDSLAKNWTAF